MKKLTSHIFVACLFFVIILFSVRAEEIPVATGFDFPVGKPDASGYYRARGFTPKVYPAEMWNGTSGGDSDLGEPVYSIADGEVIAAKDLGKGWGEVVLIRHRFQDRDGTIRSVDSFYAHVQNLTVQTGDRVERGEQIAEIGNASGLYLAHLRFEIRKNVKIGLRTSEYSKDYSNYYSPTAFIKERRPRNQGRTKHD